MKKRLSSQKGFALVVLVMVVAMMATFLILITTRYFQNMLADQTYMQNRIYGLQIMQDFGVLARRANDLYLSNGGCSVPPATIQAPTGQPFCWAPGKTTNCVMDPRGMNAASTTLAQICADFSNFTTNNTVNVAAIELRDPSTAWDRFRWTAKMLYDRREAIGQKMFNDFVGLFDGSAQAALSTPETFDPPLTGAPTAPTMTVPPCTNSMPGDTNCKRCTGGLGNQNVSCVEIRVCLRNMDMSGAGTGGGGCSSPINLDEWFREEIGVMSR